MLMRALCNMMPLMTKKSAFIRYLCRYTWYASVIARDERYCYAYAEQSDGDEALLRLFIVIRHTMTRGDYEKMLAILLRYVVAARYVTL